MSELEEMRVFVSLVEAGSATKAAERMGLAVSAISRRMKELESRLGVSLIQRTTRTMNISEDGKWFYERCIRILQDIEEAQIQVSQTAKELSGNIRISTPLSFGIIHLSPLITSFMQMHPKITIDVHMSDQRVNLVEEGFDLALRVGQLKDSTLIARKISGLNHKVCCSPNFLKQHGPFQNPAALENMPGLCYSNLKTPERWIYFDNEGRKRSVKVCPKILSTNGDVLREAAEGGLGILCEPAFIVQAALHKGTLVNLLSDYQWYDMQMNVVYPFTRHLSSRVRAFVDYLLSQLPKRLDVYTH
ncbi:MAG: LysR family transcriptional regulator [Pseudomonadota bacterium]